MIKRGILFILIFLVSTLFSVTFILGSTSKSHNFAFSLEKILESKISINAMKTGETSEIQSLFLKPDGGESNVLLMLIAYNKEFTHEVQRILQCSKQPIIFSVSTLPFNESYFDPSLLIFEQNEYRWHPDPSNNGNDIIPIGKNAEFRGPLQDGTILQGVILLPETFNLDQPVTILYKNFKKTIKLSPVFQ